jgi:hypothetical protein
MPAIGIAKALTQQGFGARILAFHKTITEACRHKIKERQDLPSLIEEGG